ncbi:MAG: methyltransferase domain-containing protein [Dethiobacter sp.]|nr:methyltransferase domain-containing protein [Dethiobacter sp.]MBS3898487.1 methyltransferase domain-containing protein [Dethiobacter sp.]MBS3983741.1 methyltransferase domain-containing protein [Dethiobacter sp.]
MVLQKPLLFARELISRSLKAGGCAVDATSGNGHDTVFLAEVVGRTGSVLAFDIQPQAIAATRQRLAASGLLERVSVIEDSHAKMAAYSQTTFDAAMFNLGYLPQADHAIVTKPESTVAALDFATKQLNKGGIITILVYTGHEGGREEWEKVREFSLALPQQQFTVLEYRLINQKNNPPFLLAISRL